MAPTPIHPDPGHHENAAEHAHRFQDRDPAAPRAPREAEDQPYRERKDGDEPEDREHLQGIGHRHARGPPLPAPDPGALDPMAAMVVAVNSSRRLR